MNTNSFFSSGSGKPNLDLYASNNFHSNGQEVVSPGSDFFVKTEDLVKEKRNNEVNKTIEAALTVTKSEK